MLVVVDKSALADTLELVDKLELVDMLVKDKVWVLKFQEVGIEISGTVLLLHISTSLGSPKGSFSQISTG